MKAALEKFGFTGCKDSDLEPVFTYLEFCLKQVSLSALLLLAARSCLLCWGFLHTRMKCILFHIA